MDWAPLEWLETASYLVTVVGLPFAIAVSLFGRAYLLVYEKRMNRQRQRMWMSWEDYMRDWCRRADFRQLLSELLVGEDPDFVAHITRIAAEEAPSVEPGVVPLRRAHWCWIT